MFIIIIIRITGSDNLLKMAYHLVVLTVNHNSES